MDEDTSFEAYGNLLISLCSISLYYMMFNAVSELAKDGTYAGNDAIVAVSRACAVNVVIHQLGAPHWEVLAPLAPESRQTLHIAYLRGEHYCTVCPLEGHALPKVVREVLLFMMKGCCAPPSSAFWLWSLVGANIL